MNFSSRDSLPQKSESSDQRPQESLQISQIVEETKAENASQS